MQRKGREDQGKDAEASFLAKTIRLARISMFLRGGRVETSWDKRERSAARCSFLVGKIGTCIVVYKD